MSGESPKFEILLDSDSDGESLFITLEPSWNVRLVNMHDQALEGVQLEELINSSMDSAVGSVESLFDFEEEHGSFLDVLNEPSPKNIFSIPSPSCYQPDTKDVSNDDW